GRGARGGAKDGVQQGGREEGLDTLQSRNAGPVCCNAWFGPALEFPLGCKPAALCNPTMHALPQAVNRTGTMPCCKLRRRFPISRRTSLLLASRGRIRIASRDDKRSDRRNVWGCFRWVSWLA